MNIFSTVRARGIIETVLGSARNKQNDDLKIDKKFLDHEYPMGH